MASPQGVQLSDWIGAMARDADEREARLYRQRMAEALFVAENAAAQLKRCDEKNAPEWKRLQDRYEADLVLLENMESGR